MIIALKSFKNKTFFCANCMKNIGRVLGGSFSAVIIFLVIFNTCKSEPRKMNENGLLKSLTLPDNSTKLHQHHRTGNVTTKEPLHDQTLPMKTRKSSVPDNTSKTISNVMITQDNNSYVMLSPSHSSHFHNLIDLLSQHSSDVVENNINNNQSTMDNPAHLLSSLNGYNPLKSETNSSDPYFEMLYDLALDINPVYSESPNKSTCNLFFNISTSHDELDLEYDENNLNKL